MLNNSILLIYLILVPLCLTNNCDLLSPAPLNTSCAIMSQKKPNACDHCKNGYGLLNNQCYPPCKQGYTQLMPGYCYNSTPISEHEDLQLCSTNSTHLTGNNCMTPQNSTCHCGPPCPPGYAGVGCTCIYEEDKQIKSSAIQQSTNWMLIVIILGILTIALISVYFCHSFLKTRAKGSFGKEIIEMETADYNQLASKV